MKAIVLETPGPIERRPLALREWPRPTPGPGEVLLRVRACGVCHTDLHEAEGELPMAGSPRIPGHQIVGVVEEVGPGVSRFAVGQRAGVAWLHRACGRCRFCSSDRENLCPDAAFTGWHVDGGYAEYAKAPESFACALPDGGADEQAAPLLCAGIIGYRALRVAQVRPGSRLGLYGFGASAHIAIQVARHWGCEVHVFSRAESHRRLARELGAAWAGHAGERPPALLDSAIIFAPAGGLVPAALQALDRGGTLTLAGIHMSEIPPLEYGRDLYFERGLRSVANATRRDAKEFLALAATIPVRTLVRTFPLEQANEALIELKAGRIEGAAVLVVR